MRGSGAPPAADRPDLPARGVLAAVAGLAAIVHSFPPMPMTNTLALLPVVLFTLGCGTANHQARTPPLAGVTTASQAGDKAHEHSAPAGPATEPASKQACSCMAGGAHGASSSAGNTNGKSHDHAQASAPAPKPAAEHECSCMTGAGHGKGHHGSMAGAGHGEGHKGK
jgi:hypothetical protein